MTLARANLLIEKIREFKEEREITRTQFIDALETIVYECGANPENTSWLNQAVQTKQLIVDYACRNIKVKYYYHEQTKNLTYYLIN